MILHRKKEEVKRFDTIKLIIALILLAILIIMLLTGNAVNETAVSDTTAPDTTTEVENADVALAAPAFDAPDGTLNSGEVTLSGTGEPGSEVAILVDGEVVGTTTVGSDGTWSFATDLEAGDYIFSAQTLDADGNIAAESDGLSVSVADALVLPTISLPAAGLMAGTVALSGTGTPGSTVELFANGISIGTSTVGAGGFWVFDAELGDGDVALTAQATDADGNETAVTDALSLSLLPAFVAPTFNLPDGELIAGTVALSGTGTPGSITEIVVDGEVVGTTTVGEDGTWAVDVDLPEGGDYELSARSLDGDGNETAVSDPFNLSLASIDLPEFELPTLTLPDLGFTPDGYAIGGTGSPGQEIEIVVDGEVVGTTTIGDDGTWAYNLDLAEGDYQLSTRALDANGQLLGESESTTVTISAAIAAPTITQPEDGATLQSGELVFAGTGTPGSEIEILDIGVVVGTAVVGDDGTWQFSFTPEAGNHEYAVRNAGDDAVAASIMATIEVPVTDSSATDVCGDPAPGIDQGATYIVGECEWLIRIANRVGVDYKALLGVNPDIENPNIIYPGQVINLPPR